MAIDRVARSRGPEFAQGHAGVVPYVLLAHRRVRVSGGVVAARLVVFPRIAVTAVIVTWVLVSSKMHVGVMAAALVPSSALVASPPVLLAVGVPRASVMWLPSPASAATVVVVATCRR